MNSRILIAVLASVTFACIGIVEMSVAQEALDQAQEVSGDIQAFYQPRGCPTAGVNGAAQTFTAGLTGTLTRVELYLAKEPWTTDTSTVAVEIHDGSPTGTLLATSNTVMSQDIPLTPNHAWVSFVFASPATVTPGHVYAIVLPLDLPAPDSFDPTFLWPGTADDVYTAGVAWGHYCLDAPDAWGSYVFGSDWTFRTFVTELPTATRGTSWGALKSLYR